MKRMFLLAILCPVLAFAQVKKCTIDGQTVYSDSQCGQQGARVNTTANTVDGSGIRKEAQRQREMEEQTALDSQRASLAANAPLECKFKSFKNRDEKGKLLALRAQDECIQNIMNARQGKPASLVAYSLWKDHHDRASTDRNAAAARDSAAAAASDIARSNRNGGVLTCTKDRASFDSSMTCR